MISFLLIVSAGIIRVLAAFFVRHFNIEGKDLTAKENQKKVLIIRIVNIFSIALIFLAILFAVIPSLRKLQ